MVFEPARENGDLVQARKGTGAVVATCHGRAAHAAKGAEEGRNAILALADFLLQAARVPDEYPEVTLNVGRIRGGTATNIVPDLAVAEIDVRCARRAEGERALARLQELAAAVGAREGFRFELTGGFHRPPLEATQANRALFAAYQECGSRLGLSFGAQAVGGGSDGNLFAEAGLPVLDGLGPVGGALHSEREWIRVSSLAERARLAALFLAGVAAGEIVLPARTVRPRAPG
jgi:glutamate carboxypeptidase